MKHDQPPYELALGFLSLRLRTIHEVRERLRKKGYSESDTEETLKTLQDNLALDDKKYTEEFINLSLKNRFEGSRLVRQKLMKRGVASGIIDETLKNMYTREIELEKCEQLGKAKLLEMKRKKNQKNIPGRLGGFLERRGFPVDMVWSTLESLGLMS